jgi:hypothetical protein
MMGKLKALILLLIVFGSIYAGWKLIPPYFHNYQFQDELDDIARRATYQAKTDDDLRQLIITKAASYDIPLRDDQIAIARQPDGVGITVHYRIHVDMLVHPVDLDFTTNSLNKRI